MIVNMGDSWIDRHHGVCIDLINTLDWRLTSAPEDNLDTYGDVLAWADKVGVLSKSRIKVLAQRAHVQPKLAQGALEQTKQVREVMARIFVSRAQGRRPKPSDLKELDQAYGEVSAQLELGYMNGAYAWRVPSTVVDFNMPWWAAVRSAVALLTSPQLECVGQCADARGCGWLFLDTTKNKSRRFCSSTSCANVAKQARHRERLLQAARSGK